MNAHSIAYSVADAIYDHNRPMRIVPDGDAAIGTGTLRDVEPFQVVLIHVNIFDGLDASVKITSQEEGWVMESILLVEKLEPSLAFATGLSLRRQLLRTARWESAL